MAVNRKGQAAYAAAEWPGPCVTAKAEMKTWRSDVPDSRKTRAARNQRNIITKAAPTLAAGDQHAPALVLVEGKPAEPCRQQQEALHGQQGEHAAIRREPEPAATGLAVRSVGHDDSIGTEGGGRKAEGRNKAEGGRRKEKAKPQAIGPTQSFNLFILHIAPAGNRRRPG